MTKPSTIWCLFSVANLYDQPDNHLVVWWSAKPSFDNLAKVLGQTFPAATDEDTLNIVHLWEGKRVTCVGGAVQYRLEKVKEGPL